MTSSEASSDVLLMCHLSAGRFGGNNHIMDWDKGKIITSETNKFKCWIKEATEIRKRVRDTINQDEGAYTLSHTWDSLLQRPPRAEGERPVRRTLDRSAEPTS